MKTKAELIKWCESKLGTPYVYGAKGKKLTQAQIDEWARLYPGTFSSAYIAKAKKYIGRECTDCSGLISWLTGILRGSANYKDTAVQTVAIGKLDESMVGWAVWKSGHIGVYIGNGYCIEAKGIDYGTVKTRVSATAWTHVLKLKDIDYAAQYVPGWHKDNNGWWYADTKSSYHKSCWQIINGHKYRFNPDGYALTNWQEIDGKWYYFEPRAGHKHECALYVTDKNGVQGVGEF